MLSLTIPCVSFYLVWNSNCQTIIFEVGSLLIKEGTMCSAAMCTFPIHSVKHPITLWNQLLKDPELKYEFLVLFSHPFWVPTLIEVPFSFDIIWGSHSCWGQFQNDKACCCSIFPCASSPWFWGWFSWQNSLPPFQTLLISSVYQAVTKGDRGTFAEKNFLCTAGLAMCWR